MNPTLRGYYADFRSAITGTEYQLMTWGEDVDPGHWQGVPTDVSMVTKELMDVHFTVPMPVGNDPEWQNSKTYIENLASEIKPNLPWADDHFEERVSRVPSNPGEQYKNWPWWRGQTSLTDAERSTNDPQAGGDDPTNFRFSHTYQERFWPKKAADRHQDLMARGVGMRLRGIRYNYGDLDDVVNLLLREPHTRQAYLPIFFPEDTGAVHGGRIPCTLGYHFLLRNNQLHTWYTIRSCDWVRHFRDDLYLAARLLLWVLEELQVIRNGDTLTMEQLAAKANVWSKVTPGLFHFHCFSLHVHKGDMHHVQN